MADLRTNGNCNPDNKDDLYFLPFVIVKVDGVLFRVPNAQFEAEVPNFFHRFGIVKDGVTELPGISKDDFRALLSVMYPSARTGPTYDDCLITLDLASRWNLTQSRKAAISFMSKMDAFKSKSPIDVALLGKKYRVWDWLCSSYSDLVQRDSLSIGDLVSSSNNQAGELDWETKARILQAWSMYHPWNPKATEGRAKCILCLNMTNIIRSNALRRIDYLPKYRCPTHPTIDHCISSVFCQESIEMGGEPGDPLAGERLPLKTSNPRPMFSNKQRTLAGTFVCNDTSGEPQWLISAFVDGAVIPSKVNLGYVHVSDRGRERIYDGHYDLLIYTPEKMEWVRTSHGNIPDGRLPVRGGYEKAGTRQWLYHALAVVNNTQVPGRTGQHMGGAKVVYGGDEYAFTENYDILCWK